MERRNLIGTFYFSLLMVLALACLLSAQPRRDVLAKPADIAKSTVVKGETRFLGKGEVWTWVDLGPNGQARSLGVTFTASALEGLPQSETATVLSLPEQAVAAGFRYLDLDWNPQGHSPHSIYDKAHFDFHFFTVSKDKTDRFGAGKKVEALADIAPGHELVPTGYVMAPGSYFPGHGSHWIHPSSPEFNGKPFTTTFIYGFYNGEMTFLEPMMTRAFLETLPDEVHDVQVPPAREHPAGYFPLRYSVRYDPVEKTYTVAMLDLIER